MTTLAFESTTKRFGARLVVDDVSFVVPAGRVVGFIGPNGAGKTTTLRILLGLVRADGGRATVDGLPYRALRCPAAVVGASLDGQSFYPGRTGRQHLRILTRALGRPASAADDLLEAVQLASAADQRIGSYSLGMRARLGLASALVGDPPALVLDEPTNGLDPAGVRWLRGVLRERAARGCAVLVSTHVLQELDHVADDAVFLSRGRVVRAGELAALRRGDRPVTVVRADDLGTLAPALRAAQLHVTASGDALTVGAPSALVGRIAFDSGVVVTELRQERHELEDVFHALTAHDGGGS